MPEEKQPAIDYVLTEEHDDDGFYIIKGYEVEPRNLRNTIPRSHYQLAGG